jgi:serine/threonine protein kinase
MIKNEIELLSKFKDTPNVIKFIESFEFDEGDDKNHQTYIVTEIA